MLQLLGSIISSWVCEYRASRSNKVAENQWRLKPQRAVAEKDLCKFPLMLGSQPPLVSSATPPPPGTPF
jgi:hypothetical protein